MSKPPIEANICEQGGAFYPVRLHAVPRVGELIDLHSFVDQLEGREHNHYYEVVQVVHKMFDAALNEGDKGHEKGWHFVEVFVRPSISEFLKLGKKPSAPATNN